jgi:hypothetical protein
MPIPSAVQNTANRKSSVVDMAPDQVAALRAGRAQFGIVDAESKGDSHAG